MILFSQIKPCIEFDDLNLIKSSKDIGQTSLEQGFAINLMTYDLKVIGITLSCQIDALKKRAYSYNTGQKSYRYYLPTADIYQTIFFLLHREPNYRDYSFSKIPNLLARISNTGTMKIETSKLCFSLHTYLLEPASHLHSLLDPPPVCVWLPPHSHDFCQYTHRFHFIQQDSKICVLLSSLFTRVLNSPVTLFCIKT